MTNPTSNYNFQMPTATDLVTDLPADFEVFGQAVDTRLKALQPGTTLGDLAYSSATANTNTRLPIGTSGQVLAVSGGGVPAWTTTADVTPLTTKGDLFTFTTVDARIGVGANGTILTADSAEATGLKWATPSGGKVLQVVQATYATEQSSSSTTYVTSGLTVSITPTSATSKIYVHAITNGLTKSSGSANNASNIRLLRNATTTIITSSGINYTGTDGTNQGQGVIQYLDSPATTSATTYDVYFANRFASGTVYAQDGNQTSVITAWEIGA